MASQSGCNGSLRRVVKLENNCGYDRSCRDRVEKHFAEQGLYINAVVKASNKWKDRAGPFSFIKQNEGQPLIL